MRDTLQTIVLVVVVAWLAVAVFGSILRADTTFGQESGCGKDYYVDYLVFTKLFCEVPHVSH